MTFDLTPDQDAFKTAVERFAGEQVAPQAAAIDETGAWPRALRPAAAGLGLLGLTVPEAAGGAGRTAVDAVLAIEALARVSGSVALSVAIHNGLVADVVARFGSDAQRRQWLGALARGEAIGAFALAEGEAGGDPARLATTAIPDGDGWRLRGRKVWVANADAAGVVLVVAAGQEAGAAGVQAFLVPLEAAGVTRTPRDSVGLRGVGCADLDLDVRIGGDQRLPRSAEAVAWAADGGRVLLAALALGLGQAALDEAIAYGTRRQAFGRTVSSSQSFQWGLADAATELDSARLLTWKAAAERARDAGTPIDAAMAKLHAAEAAHRAVDRAAQILSSSGYGRGSVIDRLCRDVRGVEIAQGTADLQRMAIAAAMLPA
ncbi:MAG TPA: acyl-CoA dehydrogenase family protein [Vicinamibacterales bacterium]|nr:acyl-CoA dehydrogenase family protein [Vicinamibacterales bacterium]